MITAFLFCWGFALLQILMMALITLSRHKDFRKDP